MSAGQQEGIHGAGGQAGSQVRFCHELGKQWSLHWHALPAVHHEPFWILLGTRGSCRLWLMHRTLLNVGLQAIAQLSFCSLFKGPRTPPQEVPQSWGSHGPSLLSPALSWLGLLPVCLSLARMWEPRDAPRGWGTTGPAANPCFTPVAMSRGALLLCWQAWGCGFS